MSWYGSVARRTSATISSAERGWSAQAGMALNTRPASAMCRPRRMAAAYTRRVSTNVSVPSSIGAMFTIGPALTYTPDLFGHTRRLVEQQSAQAENQARQLAAAYLTLTADTVTQAVTIASTSAQIKAVNDVIAADEHNLELVRTAFTAGR